MLFRVCRYDFLHKKGILLPDDAFRERSNGEGGHIKLWSVVEKVEADLNIAEEQYKDEMSEEQGQFAENINFISNHVNRLSGYTDMAKVLYFSIEYTSVIPAHRQAGARKCSR